MRRQAQLPGSAGATRCSSPLPVPRHPKALSAPASRAPSASGLHLYIGDGGVIKRNHTEAQRSLEIISPRTLAYIAQPAVLAPNNLPMPILPSTLAARRNADIRLGPLPTHRLNENETKTLRRLQIDRIRTERNNPPPPPASPRMEDDAVPVPLEPVPPPSSRRPLGELLNAMPQLGLSARPTITGGGRRQAGSQARPTPRAAEVAEREAERAQRRANAASAAAATAVAEAEAKATAARDVKLLTPRSAEEARELDANTLWQLTKAPRAAAVAAKAAETAQQTAEELGHRARIAEFQALAHSENPNVRTCCSSQAVQTLTSLSGFVREEKQNTSNDASLIGSPLKQSMPMPESPYRPRIRKSARDRIQPRWKA